MVPKPNLNGEVLGKVVPENVKTIKFLDSSKVILYPRKKFEKLFPTAARRLERGLPADTYVIYHDDRFVVVATYIPEQKRPILKKIYAPIFWGDVKKLVDVVPNAR